MFVEGYDVSRKEELKKAGAKLVGLCRPKTWTENDVATHALFEGKHTDATKRPVIHHAMECRFCVWLEPGEDLDALIRVDLGHTLVEEKEVDGNKTTQPIGALVLEEKPEPKPDTGRNLAPDPMQQEVSKEEAKAAHAAAVAKRAAELGIEIGDSDTIEQVESAIKEAEQATDETEGESDDPGNDTGGDDSSPEDDDVGGDSGEVVQDNDSTGDAPDVTADTSEAEVDDLTKIKGVGPATADRLVAAGVTTFAKVASMTPEALDKIIIDAGGTDPKSEGWPVDAARLDREKHAAK